ncbi:MAG: primosomal protein N' [Candidatus Omnitrophica bacterium]|nr:primosomal protein N' [Candidatus Omnitrophota bacterium]
MSADKYVQVVVNLPLKSEFDYFVPRSLHSKVDLGKRVWVPFRNRTIVGYIVGITEKSRIKKIKEIKSVIDDTPIISPEILELTRWISEYYFCSRGEAIEAALASPFKKGKTQVRVRAGGSPYPVLENLSGKTKDNILTAHQDKALNEISEHLNREEFGVFLLHGITASGKTEVYFGAIEQTLAKNRQAIVFVPEIALTPQTLERFTEKFGKDLIALIHSRLSKSEKFVEWQRIKSEQAKIVIGPRSAIFAPVKHLGLIVVDEEHENTYKQEDAPRYHLVNTAIKRAEISNAVVILGSATPSLESMYSAKQKDFVFIELPERIEGRDLPQVQVVDMRYQRRSAKRPLILSKALEDNIAQCLKNKEQVILFLNRRGFSTFIQCPKCGYVEKCPKCNVAVVYHFDRQQLVCHHCSYHTQAGQVCPECSAGYIRYLGTGTQKVESELYRLFPQACIGRMDSDALKEKNAHFEIFDDFKSGKIDILVGTQMLAKGLDIPNVTLVGVISADVTLNLPDFRASERTFSLLTQVAGRAGRGKTPGRVIIQTYTPEHYAIKCALNHDYNDFYRQEIVFRKQLKLPPYTHLINITLRSKNKEMLIKNSHKLFDILSRHNKKQVILMGPVPAPVSKLRGNFRWLIIAKCSDILQANKLLSKCFDEWKAHSNVKVTVDVDPRAIG